MAWRVLSLKRFFLASEAMSDLLQPFAVSGPVPARGSADVARWLIPVAFFAAGFAPIVALSIALFGLLPIHATAIAVVLPSSIAVVILGIRYPVHGRQAIKGLMWGMSATLIYDGTRLPFLLSGSWPDFIPKIGGLVLHSSRPNGVVGYLWRYVGDGGGMGMAFAMIAPRLKRYVCIRKAAVAYGFVIWLCLMATLHGCPDPQRLMFVLTPVTLVMSLVGHVVYGFFLGVQIRP